MARALCEFLLEVMGSVRVAVLGISTGLLSLDRSFPLLPLLSRLWETGSHAYVNSCHLS